MAPVSKILTSAHVRICQAPQGLLIKGSSRAPVKDSGVPVGLIEGRLGVDIFCCWFGPFLLNQNLGIYDPGNAD